MKSIGFGGPSEVDDYDLILTPVVPTGKIFATVFADIEKAPSRVWWEIMAPS